MKNLFLSVILILGINQMMVAQTPEKINYQSVVRNSNGIIIPNQSVSFKISILKGSANGTPVYTERHTTATDNFGLVRLEIGGGTVLSGNFSTIYWRGDKYFVKTELDATGGNNYTNMGTSQLLSVPYALHAKTAKNLIGGYARPMIYNLTKTAADKEVTTPAIGKNGIFTLFAGDLYLRNFWGVCIDRNAGNYGYNAHQYSNGTNPDAGSFAVRYRLNSTNFRTDLIVRGNGNVGIGTTNPARKLHITQAMRLEPSATAPSNPSAGDMYFSSTNKKLMVYDGVAWKACW